MLVQLLRAKQHDRGGYLTDADLEDVARQAKVPLYRVEELVSFFAHFRRQTPPYLRVEVCRDMSCAHRGSDAVRRKIEDLAKVSGKEIVVEGVSCLGRCDRAPALCASRHGDKPIHEHVYVGGNQVSDRLASIVQRLIAGEDVPADHDADYTGATTGFAAWKLNVYGRRPELGPYGAVRKFVAECEAEAPPPRARRGSRSSRRRPSASSASRPGSPSAGSRTSRTRISSAWGARGCRRRTSGATFRCEASR